jgi:hypothetical protein
MTFVPHQRLPWGLAFLAIIGLSLVLWWVILMPFALW